MPKKQSSDKQRRKPIKRNVDEVENEVKTKMQDEKK